MKRLVTLVCALSLTALASAQMLPGGSGGDFKTANVKANDARMNFETGQIHSLRGDAYIELIPDTPSKPTLRITADEITFNYTEAGKSPSAIVMTGGVNVDQAPYVIKSERGEWKGNQLVLTGNVSVKNQAGGEYRGSEMVFNQETGDLSVKGLNAVGVDLKGAGAGPGGSGGKEDQSPYLFSASDIKDWPAFLSALNAQGAAAEPSPGKQILAQLSPDMRKNLSTITTRQAPNAQVQSAIVKQLNGVLKKKGLYDASAWKGVEIGAEADGLLKKGDALTSAEVIQLNRRLIEAAYPNAIAKHG